VTVSWQLCEVSSFCAVAVVTSVDESANNLRIVYRHESASLAICRVCVGEGNGARVKGSVAVRPANINPLCQVQVIMCLA
jgi:hypothetical protein